MSEGRTFLQLGVVDPKLDCLLSSLDQTSPMATNWKKDQPDQLVLNFCLLPSQF